MTVRGLVRSATAALLALVLLVPGFARVVEAGTKDAQYSTAPAKPAGKRWRIAYLEGGQYTDYEIILKAIVRGLVQLGWMEPLDLPAANNPVPGGFWAYLARNVQSEYIEFVADGYYAPGNFDKGERPKVRAALLQRLNEKKDIDLVIAMGTWAGQDLATHEHRVPTVVASSSDPIASGIVKSAEDSGHDHMHAKVELGRYQRQVELFRDMVPFRKLGLVYEDSREGRTFGGVDAVEQVARERGFDILRCHTPFSGVSKQQAEQGVARCYSEIAAEADAVYVTVHQGVSAENMPNILAPLIEKRLPTFSMQGSGDVRRGVLMSVAHANFNYVGLFHAQSIARIFNGAQPRDLEQRWVAPSKIALNLKTARMIGFDPPADIMLAADEIYEAIEGRTIAGVN
jgi:ABC-type uncharacterized transport system substrate-binding protein